MIAQGQGEDHANHALLYGLVGRLVAQEAAFCYHILKPASWAIQE